MSFKDYVIIFIIVSFVSVISSISVVARNKNEAVKIAGGIENYQARQQIYSEPIWKQIQAGQIQQFVANVNNAIAQQSGSVATGTVQ